jgi:ribosomal protein S27E
MMGQMSARDPRAEREFVFAPTPAVAASRARQKYVDCSVCRADESQYLFHNRGVRFVRCGKCGLVYANPVGGQPVNYFDIARNGRLVTSTDRQLAVRDFHGLLAQLQTAFTGLSVDSPRSALLLGRWLPEFADLPLGQAMNLRVATLTDEQFAAIAVDSSLDSVRPLLGAQPELVILHEFLEACSDPARVVEQLVTSLPRGTMFAVTYASVQSLPARMMRRYWRHFFEVKSAFFNASHVSALLSRYGYERAIELGCPTTRTLGYVLGRSAPRARVTRAIMNTPLEAISAPLRTGHRVALFRPAERAAQPEKLTVVLPAYNEERYVADVIEAVLRKPLKIEKELVIVESNSRDRTREIVRGYEGRPGVRVVLEDAPRGKGHAVRSGLAAATGTIILIQDADFEYDVDDYDALLEPILQHRTDFVLGSRSLGLDDWKVRRYASSPVKGLLMNLAQVGFAKTFNLLYHQRTTDVNTMFKVFRRECLTAIELEGNGFELDIELVCKLVLAGYAPLEVPVNYVSRGFDEGKKINFWRDAFPSYGTFFKYRFK